MSVQFILTGDPNQGKTTRLQSILARLQTEGVNPCGFLAPGIWENNQKVGYNLLNLQTGQSHTLARVTQIEQATLHGRFYFSDAAILSGESILKNASTNSCDLAIIDEIGRFELSGNIWCRALTRLHENSEVPALIVVRNSLIGKINSFFHIIEPTIFHVNDDDKDMLNSILKFVNKSRITD